MRWAAVGLLLVALPAAAGLPPLTGNDAGLYVGLAGDYMLGRNPFAFSIEQCSKRSDPATLRRQVERLHAGGKRVILDFFLYDKGDEPAKPAADYLANLDQLLSRLPLEQVYAVTLSEENIYWLGRAEMLTELYRLVKAKYPALAVYQWYSPGASAPGFGWPLLPADGWVIDEYCLPAAQFERLVRQYKLLDKPLIHIAWAAPDWPEFATWDKVWDDQLAICRRYDVPIAFFCWWPPNSTPPPPGNQSMWSWSAPPGTAHHRVWNQLVLPYVERLRAGLPVGEGADRVPGQAVPVAGDLDGRFSYLEHFAASPQLVGDAAITGFTGLRWTGRYLEAKTGQSATITYGFESLWPLHEVTAGLLGNGPALGCALSVSADGSRWHTVRGAKPLTCTLPEAAGELRRFLVRIELASTAERTATVSQLHVTARVEPPATPEVALTIGPDGRVVYTDDFGSQRYLHSGRVTNPAAVTWRRGLIGLFGRAGAANDAVIEYHFRCAQPLHKVRATVACAASVVDFASSVALSLSLDGRTYQPVASSRDGGRPAFRGELARALEAGPVREFWVRLQLVNACGAATKTLSPTLQRLTVTGEPAPP